MSHTNSEFEFAPCLTVLTGPNNSGKSAVVEALQCLCGHGKSGYMVRHGEKETSVEVETGEGDVVQWRRIKNTPSFLINGKEHFRGEPEDLDKVLRLPRIPAKEGNDEFDVHFGEQKKPIFLLGDSGSRSAAFFASSSDAQYLVQMQDLHKQRTRDAKTEAQRLRGEIKKLDEKLTELQPLTDLEPALVQLERDHKGLVEREEACEVLESTLTILRFDSVQATAKRAPIVALRDLCEPPLQQPTGPLATAIDTLASAESVAIRSGMRAKSLADLCPPPTLSDEKRLAETASLLEASVRNAAIAGMTSRSLNSLALPPEYRDLGSLTNAVGSLRTLQTAFKLWQGRQNVLAGLAAVAEQRDTRPLIETLGRLSQAEAGVANLRRTLDRAEEDLAHCQRAIAEWAEANKACPTCGAPVDLQRMMGRLEAAVG